MKKILFSTLLFILYSSVVYSQTSCQAMFTYSGTGGSPNIISFTNSSSIGGNPIFSTVSYFWDFGDNNMDTVQNPIHTYINNGIYYPCLTITVVDPNGNACTSVYCDSILIGNAPPASWDCTAATGCYDPGTGNGQYTTLAACQSACVVTTSWDCSPANGCYDPGTGNGQYTTLAACQSACSSVSSAPCDSMTVTGSQYQLVMEVNNINTIIDYWVTSAPDGTVLQEDSMINTHTIYNYNPSTSLPYDTINTCITYPMSTGTGSITWITCCVTWIWNGSYWAKIGNVTSIGEINSSNKKIIKVVDVLGRETSINSNQTLFFIYEDGTIEKKIILE